MSEIEYWNVFEQTGAIKDYLTYTACTSEYTKDLGQTEENKNWNISEHKEGGTLDNTKEVNWNDFVSNPDWRI